MEEPKTPTLNRISANREVSQQLGEFIDWLNGQGVELAHRHQHSKG